VPDDASERAGGASFHHPQQVAHVSRLVVSVAVVLAGAVAALAMAMWYGGRTWNLESERIFAELREAPTLHVAPAPSDVANVRSPVTHASPGATLLDAPAITPADWAGLPAPVQRYFARTLQRGARRVALADIRHTGDFALRPNDWKPFTSLQRYSTRPRGFAWDATIRMMPLLPVRVRDTYINGAASMRGAAGGLVTIVNQAGTPGLASGALMRYLAELAWLPTALLPSEGVEWTAVDDSTAHATLIDAFTSVSLDFHFYAEGGIARVSGVRMRDVEGTAIPTPWEGVFSRDVVTVDGMQLPASAEVAWTLPEGRHAYWRGRVEDVRYTYRR